MKGYCLVSDMEAGITMFTDVLYSFTMHYILYFHRKKKFLISYVNPVGICGGGNLSENMQFV